jgi:hypothetical protein
MHIEFKENYKKKEMLHSSITQEEETSTPMVDSWEEDKEEAWVEVEVRLFSIIVPSQVIWKRIVRTLTLLATTVIHLIMSLNIVQCYWLNFRKDEVETRKSN